MCECECVSCAHPHAWRPWVNGHAEGLGSLRMAWTVDESVCVCVCVCMCVCVCVCNRAF